MSLETQQLHLPRIVHPASRLDRDSNTMNVTARAVSRASSLGELVDRYNYNSIKPYEIAEAAFKKSKNLSSFNDLNIPDHVKAVYSTDAKKVSMPVFGMFLKF